MLASWPTSAAPRVAVLAAGRAAVSAAAAHLAERGEVHAGHVRYLP